MELQAAPAPAAGAPGAAARKPDKSDEAIPGGWSARAVHTPGKSDAAGSGGSIPAGWREGGAAEARGKFLCLRASLFLFKWRVV
jgi:hypothetical protein